MTNNETRRKIGQLILTAEARRDKNGRIAIYQLPPGDGGGTYEIAGINNHYHPKQASILKNLINTEQYTLAEQQARDYILQYTDTILTWLPPGQYPTTETILRDTCFNAGPGGAAKTLQNALNLTPDGIVGPLTKNATLQALSQGDRNLALRLHAARWEYMHQKAQNPGKQQFWNGWRNRITNTTLAALILA